MANFPTSVSTNANLYIAVNGLQTTLASSITNSVTTIPLTSTTGFPTTGFVTIENNEVVSYTGVSGGNLTGCTRGADGTTALAHSTGVTVGLTIVAAHHNLLKDELIAVETSLGAGYLQASANTANAVVQRDGSGNFVAGTITAALTGIASGNLALTGGTVTGDVTIDNQHAIIFKEPTGTGTTSVTVKAPATVTSSYTIQLPPAVAAAGQVLTDVVGNGVLSWQTSTSGITQLTGDVTAGPGSGSVAATVAFVGGQAAGVVAVVPNNVHNLLINGGFEFWQRGASFTNPANTKYTADRWAADTTDASIAVVSQETSIIETGAGSSSFKVVISGSPVSKFWAARQPLERVAQIQGRTLTFSARVKCSVASTCRVVIYDGVGQTKSSYHTGGGNWETLSVTRTMDSAATHAFLEIGMYDAGDAKNGTYYFGSAMAVFGSAAVPFFPADFATDLADCQRFYEKSYAIETAPGTNTSTNRQLVQITTEGNKFVQHFLPFKVVKRTVPTMTFYTTSGTSDTWNYGQAAGSGTTNNIAASSTAGTAGVELGTGALNTAWAAVQFDGHWVAEAEM